MLGWAGGVVQDIIACMLPVMCSSFTCTHTVPLTTVTSRLSAHERLKFTGQKTGVGVCTEKPFVRITHIHTDHRIITKKNWVGAYSGEYGTYMW